MEIHEPELSKENFSMISYDKHVVLKHKSSHIAIFDTFKTKNNKFTGEAKRQRGIICHLVLEKNPELKTKVSQADPTFFIKANKTKLLQEKIKAVHMPVVKQ